MIIIRLGLSINVITTQELILLDLINSISNKDQQRKMIEKVLEASKQRKPKREIEATLTPAYTITKALHKMK